jgi:hypothetical protein
MFCRRRKWPGHGKKAERIKVSASTDFACEKTRKTAIVCGWLWIGQIIGHCRPFANINGQIGLFGRA